MKAFYGNKATGTLHSNRSSDSCRRGEILKKNRVEVDSIAEAKKAPWFKHLCKFCVQNPRQDARSD